MDLNLSPQRAEKKIFEGEGGSYYSWSNCNFPVLGEAKVGAGRLLLHPRGFALPHYSDSSKIGYALQGSCIVGLVLPNSSEEKVIAIKKGDALLIPNDVVSWWFNSGDSDLVIVFIGETSKAYVPGEFTYYLLTGKLGVLSGFSTEFVRRAYDMSEEEAKKLTSSQMGTLIIKLEEGIQIPKPTKEGMGIGKENCFNLENSFHEINVDKGGFVSFLTASKLPLLDHVGLSAKLVKLEANAVCSATFEVNSTTVIYVVKGSGRVQIVGINGKCALEAKIHTGDLVVVPQSFVAIEVAGGEGMEYFSVITSSREDHGQVDFAALEQLENPDLHVDSVRIMNLFRKIKEVVTALECPKKFCLKDLIKPDGDRTEFFLGAMLNFCIHRDSKMSLLRPMVDDLNLLDEKRQELEARISQLNVEIAEHNESREREMPLVQDVDAKVKELRQTIPSLNNHQMSLKASIRKMKDKAKEMDEKISSAEFALVQSVQENASLRSKIVQSPDKLQRALEEKKIVRVEAKNAERAAMQGFQEKTAILEVYTKACKKLSKNLTQMQAIQEQVNSAKAIEKDVKVLKVKQGDEEMLDKSLEGKLVERQGKVEQLDEIRKQLEKEKYIRCEEATKELNIVKSEVESKRRDLEARQVKVEAIVAEVDAITMKCNSVKESEAAKRQELGRKCEEIVEEFYNYSNNIGRVLPKG